VLALQADSLRDAPSGPLSRLRYACGGPWLRVRRCHARGGQHLEAAHREAGAILVHHRGGHALGALAEGHRACHLAHEGSDAPSAPRRTSSNWSKAEDTGCQSQWMTSAFGRAQRPFRHWWRPSHF
jgi:hypothetical protein